MLIATAGHIDHGKSALVRALTGVETDRLPEEKARGITIDLGFAYWQPQPGLTIGFVDVPGHERFVRTMLAGVSAVDAALLVVAADDGVMPQTREHLEILDLLGIGKGAVAITKCDKASPGRIAQVREDVRQALAFTSLAEVSMFEVSASTGEGVAVLSEALLAMAQASPGREAAGRRLRLAIDRAFSVTGAGTVATGTVIDGRIAVGDRLVLVPGAIEARVRGLQSAGQSVQAASAGQRCAVNLAGIDLAQVSRGACLLALPGDLLTGNLEARLQVLASHERPLRHDSHVHLHVGTADVPARVLLTGRKELAPGESGIVRLLPEAPVCVACGDAFVLRDSSGRSTVGGGRIANPFLPRRRQKRDREAVTAAFETFAAAPALAALLAIDIHEVDTAHFERCFNLEPACAAALFDAAGAVRLGKAGAIALPQARVEAARDEVLALLAEHHANQPDIAGLALRDLRGRMRVRLSPAAFDAVVRLMVSDKSVEIAGGLARLPGHAPVYSAAERALWEQALPWIEERGLQPFTVMELSGELRTTEATARALVFRRRHNGEVWQLTEKRFLLDGQVTALSRVASRMSEQGEFTAAQFKDEAGIGRTLAVQVLEFLDRIGITVRSGETRTVTGNQTGSNSM